MEESENKQKAKKQVNEIKTFNIPFASGEIKENLTFEESKDSFEILMEGKASDQEIFDFLTLLSAKGEVSDEIAGGVHVLRDKSKRVNVENALDTCGTGGDGKNTLNISTASAFSIRE